MFFEYVYVFFCHSKALFGIELFCEACMPFAPYAERADVNEGDIRIAVVPFGELADQVQLDLIYVYYKMRDSEKTAAQINRFMRLNPTSQYTDYVLYMTGLNQIQMRYDMLQDFIGLNRSQKDPTQYYEALKTFRNLIETYPESKYAADAHQRMIFIKQQLAEREMSIANYYYERGSYLSAIRHCQNILYSYRGTQYLKPALALMATCYEDLGLPEAAANVRSVQEASFGTLSATEEE